MQDTLWARGEQAAPEMTAALALRLESLVAPLLLYLDRFLDKRLVRTLGRLIEVTMCFGTAHKGSC